MRNAVNEIKATIYCNCIETCFIRPCVSFTVMSRIRVSLSRTSSARVNKQAVLNMCHAHCHVYHIWHQQNGFEYPTWLTFIKPLFWYSRCRAWRSGVYSYTPDLPFRPHCAQSHVNCWTLTVTGGVGTRCWSQRLRRVAVAHNHSYSYTYDRRCFRQLF